MRKPQHPSTAAHAVELGEMQSALPQSRLEPPGQFAGTELEVDGDVGAVPRGAADALAGQDAGILILRSVVEGPLVRVVAAVGARDHPAREFGVDLPR